MQGARHKGAERTLRAIGHGSGNANLRSAPDLFYKNENKKHTKAIPNISQRISAFVFDTFGPMKGPAALATSFCRLNNG